MRDNDAQHVSPMLLVYGFIFVAAIALTYIGFSSRNPFFIGSVALIPFGVLLLNRPDVWLMTVIVLLRSKMRFPGLFGELEFVHILLFGLLCVLLAKRIIVKQPRPKEGRYWPFLYLFLLVLCITIAVRGFGFSFLGDSKVGGMRYIELLITAFLPILIYYVPLRPQQWRFALIGMGLMTLLPALADGLFILTHGAVYQQYYFLRHGATVGRVAQDIMAGEESRFGAGSAVAAGLVLIPYLVWPYRLSNAWKYFALIAAALIFAGLSGHRLSMLTALAFVWTYGFSTAGRKRKGYVLATSLAGLFSLLIIIPFVTHLPFAIQRSLAWIPFLEIDEMAKVAARGTTVWRLQVWANALQEVPEYLLIGKGYTYEASLSATLRTMNSYEAMFAWPKIMVAYHNGPLSLLIGMGIFGLLSGVGLLVAATWRHMALMSRGEWHDPILHRLHRVVAILFLIKAVSYLCIYGDVYRSFPGLFMWLSILEGLWYSNRKLTPSPNEGLHEVENPAASPQVRRIHMSDANSNQL